MMTESESAIASPSSPINAKTKKSQRQHKGKAKLVSPNSATVNPTPPAHTATSSSQPERNDSDILAAAAAAAASSDHDYDNIVVESGGDYGDFDYDAVKADDGVELWLVRAPSTIKAKNLRELDISSSRAAAAGVGLVGDLMRKGTAYDVWALDPDPASSSSSGGSSGGNANASASANDSGDPDPSAAQVVVAGVGAEELNGLSVLLPRKRKGGKLYLAQKPIKRHLVVSARPARPTRPEVAYEAPKREAYPDEVLTHRFRPYGDPGDLPREDHIDVDVVEVSPKEKDKLKRKSGGGETGSSKKRKSKSTASQQ